jgi:hypothetical protein
MDARRHLIVLGYAKVPGQSTTHAHAAYFSISLVVEPPDSTVIAVDSTAATGLTRDWLSSLLMGADLTADDSPYLETVDRHYLGPAAGSVKQAIRDAWRRYASVSTGTPE